MHQRPLPTDNAATPLPAHRAPEPRGEPESAAYGNLSRTWELELLISGAVVFALLQLPSAVDELYDRWSPQLTRSLDILLTFGYLYVKAILYTLIAAFVIHLAARAYWVGLIGLESVFPRGVRWDRMRFGPVSREVYRQRLRSLPSAIARLDNFCSVIFSFAFLIVLFCAASIVFASLLALIALLISRTLLGGERFYLVFNLLLFLLVGPPVLVSLMDRYFGDKLGESGQRVLRRLSTLFFYTQGYALLGPVMLTLFSNIPKKVIYPLFYVLFFGVLVLVAVDLFVRTDILQLNSYAYLPEEAGETSVEPRFYENQRLPGEIYGRTPSIQSDMIRDPYVRLFIPYYPRRHNAVLAERCPELEPLQEIGLRMDEPGPAPEIGDREAVLRCLAELHRVSLNGAPLSDLEFHFYRHPRTGMRGVVAYIPTATLPRGSNLLTVQPVPRPDSDERRENRPPDPPYRIRFWR